MEKTTEIAFQIISIAGEAKSIAYEALNVAKKEDYLEAKKILEKAQTKLEKAHTIQFQLITDEVNGAEYIKTNFIMVHAQDHLMNTMMTIEWIAENIALREELSLCKK